MRRRLGSPHNASAALLAFALLGPLACGRKPSTVVCHVTYGGEVRHLEFPATDSPYTVKAIDVAGRFGFKAIYVREPWRAVSINVYADQREAAETGCCKRAKYVPPFSSA